MKKHTISVSRHNLTRCSACGRHHEVDRSLSEVELLKLDCQFCGLRLIGSTEPKPVRGSRSAKLALGLLSAGLTLAGCDDDETVENATAGVEMIEAGADMPMPVYGEFPAGEEAGAEAGAEAGVEMVTAGDSMSVPLYGEFPAGAEAGAEAGTEAGVEVVTAGDSMDMPVYGEFPAGVEAGAEGGAEVINGGEGPGELPEGGDSEGP